jgi:WD40 repeat protein
VVAELARLEDNKDQRMVVVDTATASVTPIGAIRYYNSNRWNRTRLAVAGDGATVFAVGDQMLEAVDVASGERLWADSTPATIVEGTTTPWAVAASHCGQFVALGTATGGEMPRSVHIRSARTGRLLAGFPRQIFLSAGATVRSLAFHPNGWVAAGTQDGRIAHLTPNGAVTSYPVKRESSILALAFTADGSALLAGGDDGELHRIALFDNEI